MSYPPFFDRVAGAPISWGVCEAPGWGFEMRPETVLGDMAGLGLWATELGPTGYLGADPARVRDLLARHGVRLVGGFLPVPMHVKEMLDIPDITHSLRMLAECGAEVVVLAARSGDGGYDRRVTLGRAEWDTLLITLKEVEALVRAAGMTPVLHPHAGTAIEDRAAVDRLLEASDISLCVDTGHLVIGGTNPLELVRAVPGRVAHVHLKDVSHAVAARLTSGELSYIEAVRDGLYTPLGEGDLDIAAIVQALEVSGYTGWYVLEQDVALHGPPSPGHGPVESVRRSLAFLETLTAQREP